MTSRFWSRSVIFPSSKFQRCVKPPYPSCKWISPFLSFMHTNLGCPSMRTKLELVTRDSTEHCCRPQVSLRKITNQTKKNRSKCFDQCFLFVKSFLWKNEKSCILIFLGWGFLNVEECKIHMSREEIKTGKSKSIFPLHSIVYLVFYCSGKTRKEPHAIFAPYVSHYGINYNKTAARSKTPVTKQDFILNLSGSRRLRQTSCKEKVHRTMTETRCG